MRNALRVASSGTKYGVVSTSLRRARWINALTVSRAFSNGYAGPLGSSCMATLASLLTGTGFTCSRSPVSMYQSLANTPSRCATTGPCTRATSSRLGNPRTNIASARFCEPT